MSDQQPIEGRFHAGAYAGVGVGGGGGGCKDQCDDPCDDTGFSMPSSRRAQVGSHPRCVPDPRAFMYQGSPQSPECRPQNVCKEQPIGAPLDQSSPYNSAPPANIQRSLSSYNQQFGGYGQQNGQYGGQYEQPGKYGASSVNSGGPRGVVKSNGEVSKELDISHPDNRRTQTVYVNINGSLASFAQNPDNAAWTLDDDDVFQQYGKNGEKVGDPDRSIIYQASADFLKSGFPLDVLLQVDGLDGNVNASGNKGVAIVPANSVSTYGNEGKKLHRMSTGVSAVLMSIYGNMDEKSIRDGIHPLKNKDWSLVPAEHIIPEIIQMNKEIFGVNLRNFPMLIGGLYQISNTLVEKVVNSIQTQVLEKIPFKQIRPGKFVVRAVRADGRRWDDPEGIDGLGDESTLPLVLNERRTISLALSMVFSMAMKK